MCSFLVHRHCQCPIAAWPKAEKRNTTIDASVTQVTVHGGCLPILSRTIGLPFPDKWLPLPKPISMGSFYASFQPDFARHRTETAEYSIRIAFREYDLDIAGLRVCEANLQNP